MKDIYFEPNYGKLYEQVENGESVFYEFSNEHGSITNLFIKKEIPIDLDKDRRYYDITTPYGYGGPIINEVQEGKEKELLEAYYQDFKEYCHKDHIVSEFIRFHPVLGNEKQFESIYDVEFYKKTTGTNLKDFDDPFQQEFSKSTRKRSRRALRDGVTYEVTENPTSLDEFIEIYYETMDRNEAADIYYFDRDYFDKCLEYFSKNMITIKAIYEGKTIAMGTYFVYDKYIHSHLFGTLNEYLDLSPAYVIGYALTEWGKEKGYDLVHDGGGTSRDEDDSLFRFKKKFGQNTEFDYYLAKKIWDHDIYEELCELTPPKSKNHFPAYRN